MLKGIDVIYVKRVEVGRDALNAPIYEEIDEIVPNVLVAPTTSDDVINSTSLEGKKLVYTLGIPKNDTHDWIGCKVKFFGMTFKQFGYPIKGIDHLIPGPWNQKVMVELYG